MQIMFKRQYQIICENCLPLPLSIVHLRCLNVRSCAKKYSNSKLVEVYLASLDRKFQHLWTKDYNNHY